MARRSMLVSLGFVLGSTAAAHADLIGAHVESLGDLGAGVPTWRVHVDFDSPADALLMIAGDPAHAALVFTSLDGDALRNGTGPAAGTIDEDFPSVGMEAWDSWVTIGSDVPGASDAQHALTFLGGYANAPHIEGTHFSEPDGGGWYDSDPGTPEAGGSVLVAQFTVANFEFGATAIWLANEPSDPQAAAFHVTTVPGVGGMFFVTVLLRSRRRSPLA